MPFLDKIIDHINSSMKGSSLKGIQPMRFIGITTVVARQKGNVLEMLPAYQDGSAYKVVEPDERYHATIYHKTISNAYTSAKQQSFGDDLVYKCISEMMMVVMYDTRKVRHDMEPLCIYGLPQRLSKTIMQEVKFNSCLIMPTGSNTDKIMVFRQEFPGSEFFLKPYHNLFSIRYRIEATFDKNCINQCLCGE